MQLTLNEQERAAYSAGDTKLAEALGARIDMQHALAADVVSIEELQEEIEHLKRILEDALADGERLRGALQDIVGGASPVDTGRLKEMASVARTALGAAT